MLYSTLTMWRQTSSETADKSNTSKCNRANPANPIESAAANDNRTKLDPHASAHTSDRKSFCTRPRPHASTHPWHRLLFLSKLIIIHVLVSPSVYLPLETASAPTDQRHR